MNKIKTILITCLLILAQVSFVFSQSDQQNSDKYWRYRDRLLHDFTLGIGPNFGQSFPFMER